VAPRAPIATDEGGGIDQAVASEQLVSRVKAASSLRAMAQVDRLQATNARAAVATIVAMIVAEASPIAIAVAVATTAASNR
jgi:hypothetical protein